jgi:hypothetical protein
VVTRGAPPVPQGDLIAAAVRPVGGVLLSADAARLLVHWLGQLAALTQARNGAAPHGLIAVQHHLAEAAAAAGSRRREADGLGVPAVVMFEHDEQYTTPTDAAAALGISPDAVRWHRRRGNLQGRRVGRSWLISIASLESLKVRLDERRGA